MTRIRFIFLAIILSMIAISCSAKPNHDTAVKFQNLKIDITQNNQSTDVILPTHTKVQQKSTAIIQSTSSPGMNIKSFHKESRKNSILKAGTQETPPLSLHYLRKWEDVRRTGGINAGN